MLDNPARPRYISAPTTTLGSRKDSMICPCEDAPDPNRGTCLSLVLLSLLSTIALSGCSVESDGRSPVPRMISARGDSAMVVSASPLATRVGVAVLRSGGNAVDAAVAVAFALSVVYPTAGNIGGGGFMVLHVGGRSAALDFRETAPAAASRDMYLDSLGEVTALSVTGHLSAGVPGTVAGLWEAHQRFGSRPWRDLVAPAIALAGDGFVLDSAFAEDLAEEAERLVSFPSTAALFLPGGAPQGVGTSWRNPDLAATLSRISERGKEGFYTGETADLLVAEMRRGRGLITIEDLRDYRAVWREPVEFGYRGHRVISMSPPSSGGLTLALMTGILEGFDLRSTGRLSPRTIHLFARAAQQAYARRNMLLADPDFVQIPLQSFLSSDTAAALRAAIEDELLLSSPGPKGGNHTTHFSVVDAWGGAVAVTTTLNNAFGSAVTVSGAGFLLNDEMDDFTTKAGAVNAMGLRQGERNAIQSGKRMLSSMTPTIVLDSAGSPMLVTGAAGGGRIITAVAQVIINAIDFGLDLDEAMAGPRFHCQDFPDTLWLEAGRFPAEDIAALSAMGHRTAEMPGGFASVQSILRRDGRWYGVSEPRSYGRAEGY